MALSLMAIMLLTACQSSQQRKQNSLRSRIYVSHNNSLLFFQVTLEGSDGNAVSAALVSMTDPAGALAFLAFNTTKQRYEYTRPLVAGKYHVSIDSILKKEKITIPVVSISKPPKLLIVRDALGNDAITFKKLKASQTIEVTWQASPEVTKYLLELTQAGKVVYSLETTEASHIIPAGTLEGSDTGIFTNLLVTANSQQGDILYQSAPFFSVANVDSGNFSFQVIP